MALKSQKKITNMYKLRCKYSPNYQKALTLFFVQKINYNYLDLLFSNVIKQMHIHTQTATHTHTNKLYSWVAS